MRVRFEACRLRHWLAVVVLASAIAGSPAALLAQRNAVLSGVVRDEVGSAIENALVVLDAKTDRRITRSDAEGRFRFDGVRLGEHELATAFLRHVTDVRVVEVGPAGLTVDIVLRRNTALLDTVRIVAQRTGVHGLVIAHEDYSPLAAADVQLLGTGLRAKTGVNGRFEFSNAKPGAYVVHVRRDGYQARMLSVVVRRDTAVDLALTLDRAESNSDKRMAMLFKEFDRRIVWATKTNAAMIPRHELRGHTGTTLDIALRYSMSFLLKGLVVDDSTCVYINGLHQPSLAVRDVFVDNIEAVEVYGSGADYTNVVTYRNGQKPLRLTGRCGWGSPRGEAATPMVGIIGRLGPGGSLPGARSNPARVEAVVVWTRR